MNDGMRVRVYVADDHPVFRDGVVLALKRRPDFEVVGEAQDGRTALEEIRVLRPDVALLDVQMPGLDGHTVLRAVQRDDLPTAVVLLSATVLPPEAREGARRGRDGLPLQGGQPRRDLRRRRGRRARGPPAGRRRRARVGAAAAQPARARGAAA